MKIPNGLIIIVIYFIICPAVLISYLFEPFTQDVRLYLGAAKITALTPGFPMNLDLVWESRFVGHRLLYYILDMISPFDGLLYSVWMKFVVALVMIGVIYYFSKQVAERMQVSFDYIFIITFLGMFAVHHFTIFSAEAHSVIIGLAMIAMLLDDPPIINGLAGLLILPLVILKGLPVLLVPIIILVIIMLAKEDYQERLLAAACAVPIVIASYLIMAGYFPHFISDIFLNTKLAHIGSLGYLDIGTYFVKYGVGVIGFLPIVIIGLFVTFLLLSVIRKEHVGDVGLLLLMWVVAAMYSLIIQEFFYYHFYLAVIPAILTIGYFLKLYEYHDAAFTILVAVILIVYVGVVASWSVGLAGTGYAKWTDYDNAAIEILTRYPITDQPTVLYLDDGLASYYLPAPTACRYVGALPIQRHTMNWDMTGVPAYWEQQNCSLRYTGNYIIIDDTFMNISASATQTDLRTKVYSEYQLVYHNKWDIYQRRVP